MTEVVEADKLKQIISKIETIKEERLESAELLKDAYNEAKSLGFDVKIIKHVLKLKKKDKDALAEEDSLIELYRVRWVFNIFDTNHNYQRIIRVFLKAFIIYVVPNS